MEPTNTHIDAIGIGDNVWVKQGKTDHMATFLGEPRKVNVYGLTVDNTEFDNDVDDNDDNKGGAKGHQELEVLIRWATTGTKNFVPASTVRPMLAGRRRRQVVEHYKAVPSHKKPKKQRRRKPSKTTEEQPPKESSNDSKRAVPLPTEAKVPSLPQRAAAVIEKDEASQEPESKEEPPPEIKKPKFKLPSKEEFQKYQEKKQRKKEKREKKEREKEWTQKQPQQSELETIRNQSQPVENELKRKQNQRSEKELDPEPLPAGNSDTGVAGIIAAVAAPNDASKASNSDVHVPKESSKKPKFKLPSREEFQKYQEQQQRKKEEKEREKESIRKRKRQSDTEEPTGGTSNNGNRSKEPRESNFNSDARKASQLPEPATIDPEAVDSTTKTTTQGSAKLQSTKESAKEQSEKDSSKEQSEKDSAKEQAWENITKEKAKEDIAKQKAKEDIAKQKATEDIAKQKAKEDIAKQKSKEDIAKQKAKEDIAKQKATEDISKQKAKEDIVNQKAKEETSKEKAKEEISKQKANDDIAKQQDTEDTAKQQSREDSEKQQSVEDSSEQQRRGSILDIDDDDSDAIENDIEMEKLLQIEDPDHTIERGFRWQWERPETAQDKEKPPNPFHEKYKPIPSNYRTSHPRSFDEAYEMMVEFKRNDSGGKGFNCDIPSNHPFLRKYVAKLRSEYSKFRKHFREQRGPDGLDAVYRKVHKNPWRDMTRIDWDRVTKLKNLGFKFNVPGHDNSLGKNFHRPVVVFSDDGSIDDLSDSSVDDVNHSAPRSSLSIASSASCVSSSQSIDNDRGVGTIHVDHTNDDKHLIAKKLKDISLHDTTSRNKALIKKNGEYTMPIQLYRLLRLSTMRPELGLNKVIRWTDDGNGFKILDGPRFETKILSKTTNGNKMISFRNALGNSKFVVQEYGKNERGAKTWIYKHQTTVDAEEANDPSLRLFYRGAPWESLWAIKSRKEEREEKTEHNLEEKTMTNNTNGFLQDEERSIDSFSSDDNNDGTIRPSLTFHRAARASDMNGRRNKRYSQWKDESRESDRKRRRTSDGCLLPRGGAEQLLLEDGTYRRPMGAQPDGLIWDKFRGLWTPPHLLSKAAHREEESDDNDKNRERRYSGQQKSLRWTSDGCFLPKREPVQNEDGTYKKPLGHEPKNLIWDEFRGLWAPIGSKKRKVGRNSMLSSARNAMSSSSDEDSNIIKASRVNLFHHSSSILRSSFQPNNKRRKRRNQYHSRTFQARTKNNPSGIVKNTINLSNWRKIEKLMQRSAQQRTMTIHEEPVAAVVKSNTFDVGEEVALV